MLMVKLKLSYCYNYIKLVNGKAKIKLLLQLHSNIELMTEYDLRLDMCFPYKYNPFPISHPRPHWPRSMELGFIYIRQNPKYMNR